MVRSAKPENREPVESGPKYRLIYSQLRIALRNGTYEPGEKLPSENEMVEQFGASRPTVGRALTQLENEGLVERRAGSGTFVCIPQRHEGFLFGLLIPDLGTTEIFEPICRGISIARVGGHHDRLWGPTFSPGASEETQALQLCDYYVQRGVNGVFFAPMELTGGKDEVNHRITHALDEAGIPIVLLDRDITEFPRRSQYDLVGIDNRRAGFVITDHVLQSGARKVVFFARPHSAPTVNLRALGYRDAINACVPSLKPFIELGDPGDVAAVEELIERLSPDAVVCANDYTAGQFMTSLNALGIRVPSDIRVTGMDDIRYASVLQTPLTTIHQPCLQLGAAALGAMLDRVSNPQMPARDFRVDFKLVVRRSTDSEALERTNAQRDTDDDDEAT